MKDNERDPGAPEESNRLCSEATYLSYATNRTVLVVIIADNDSVRLILPKRRLLRAIKDNWRNALKSLWHVASQCTVCSCHFPSIIKRWISSSPPSYDDNTLYYIGIGFWVWVVIVPNELRLTRNPTLASSRVCYCWGIPPPSSPLWMLVVVR